MNGVFKFPFKNGANKAGKQTPDFTPNLSLGGVGIASPHCVFTYNDQVRKATLGPERYPTRVNGDLLKESVELKHGDRILIGSHAYYLYIDP
jgi:sulfur carrier protein ThiS